MGMQKALRGGPYVTVESVTEGHPDKVCDNISDEVLDASLAEDQNSRVAVEVCGKGGIKVFGEITSNAEIDFVALARRVYGEIGYDPDIEVEVDLSQQASNIALINEPENQGAGDQGIMVGYAVRNSDYEHMPTVFALAQQLVMRLSEVRRSGLMPMLGPDGKSQVVMRDGKVVTVTIAAQHSAEIDVPELRPLIHENVIVPIVGDFPLDECLINNTGAFVKGGFAADSGLTGRKIIVDQYGPLVEAGGGCFSGKDPTKVDRTAAYMCRLIAKTLIERDMADEAVVKMAFTINGKLPDMLSVETDRGPEEDLRLASWVESNFPLSPGGMIAHLGMLKPEGWSYRETAAYGHFGRPQFPWEQTNR